MKDFLLIACGAGLQDGFNPCVFMTAAVFIAHGLWLKRNSLRLGWLRIFFVLAYWTSILVFNFGPGQYIVYKKSFIFAAKILYFVLGVGAFALGVLFFKDWVLLSRGVSAGSLAEEKIKPFSVGSLDARLMTVALAVILSALASLWPVNSYVMLLGSAAILKGQWHNGIMLILIYTVIIMWPLWFVWAFITIKNLRPSLLRIFCASVCFTASSCMILMFK